MSYVETSVVVALREVRRLGNERQQRETDARAQRNEEEREWRDAQRRATQGYGAVDERRQVQPGWPQGGGFEQRMRQTSEVSPLAHDARFSGAHGTANMNGVTAAWAEPAGGSAMLPQKQSSSGRAVVLTSLVFLAAGAAGYFKLNVDFEQKLQAKHLAIGKVEDARNQALEARNRSDRESSARVAACEAQLAAAKASSAKAAEAATAVVTNAIVPAVPAAVVPAPTAPVGTAAAKAARPRVVARAPAARRASPATRPSAAADRPEVEKSAGPAPKIAKMKRISDDPLGGLDLK